MCNFSFAQTNKFELSSLSFQYAFDPTQEKPVHLEIMDGKGEHLSLDLDNAPEASTAFFVQGAELLVGKITTTGRPRLDYSLRIDSGVGTLRLLNYGGGIGISDLRNGRHTVATADLSKGPMEVYSKWVGNFHFLHVVFLGATASCPVPYSAVFEIPN